MLRPLFEGPAGSSWSAHQWAATVCSSMARRGPVAEVGEQVGPKELLDAVRVALRSGG